MTDKNRTLAEKIEAQFTCGIHLMPEVLHHIESITGAVSSRDLTEALKQADNDDIQPLFELIFYPDETQQSEFEPFFERETFDARDAGRVAAHLTQKTLYTRLIFPDGSQTDRIEIPRDALQQFLRRLNIARRIDDRITESIRSHIRQPDLAIRIKVKLRNCRFAFSENIVSFLCAYMAHMPVEAQDYLERLAFALDLLDGIEEQTDIYTALMDKKRQCAEMIRMADDSARQLRQVPVEALIMKGVSIPCISIDEARRRIDMIDEIAIRLFGGTEMMADLMAEPENAINLGVFKGRGDLDKVIKILS